MSTKTSQKGSDDKDLVEKRHDGNSESMDAVLRRNSHGDAREKNLPTLPDEVIERIVSRVPFPLLYKARCLSRSWYLKFPQPYSCVKSWSRTLEQQIVLASSKWPVYCPLYVSKDKFLGFDRRAHKWQFILTMSHPKSCHPVTLPSSIAGGGSLICVASRSQSNNACDFYVANVITKRWRLLPRCYNYHYSNHYRAPNLVQDQVWGPELVRILPSGADSYKVLLVSSRRDGPGLGEDSVRTWVYNSKLKRWTAQEPRALNILRFYSDSAYVAGTLYCLCKTATAFGSRIHLRGYDVVENSWGTILHDFGDGDAVEGVGIIDGAVLQSGKRVLIVLKVMDFGSGFERSLYGCFLHAQDSINIYELIPDSLSVEKMAAWSPYIEKLNPYSFRQIQFASDADYIYFGYWRADLNPLISYNLHTHKWSDQSIPPALSSAKETAREAAEESTKVRYYWGSLGFEPGLNPFAEV